MDNYFSVLLVVLIGFSACQSEPEKKVVRDTTSVSESVESETNKQTDSEPLVDNSTANQVEEDSQKPAEKTKEIVAEKTSPKAEKPKPAKKTKAIKSTTKDEKLSAKLVTNSKTASKKKKEKKGPLPELVFDYKTYDFGIVNHGDTVTYKFYFVNEGDAPAIISEASSSCGCTIPEYPKKPIKPGKRAYIKAVFATKGKLNTQKKSITIKANTEPNYTTLYLEGEVYNRPKKKEPIDSTKLDSIKKAKKKALKDSLKLKKKAGKNQGDLKDKNKEKTTEEPTQEKKNSTESAKQKKTSTEEAKEKKKEEEIDYFLPTPKPKKIPKKTSPKEPKKTGENSEGN